MSEKITINGKAIAVKEMTVSEQREWLSSRAQAGEEAGKEGAEVDIISWRLFEDVYLFDLPFMTDQTIKSFEDMLPSDIQRIIDACKKANPHFFGMRERVQL